MDAGVLEGGKTVLDLAIELGTQTETVLGVMRQMGLEGHDPTAVIDPELEGRLVQRMAESGRVPKRALKKRRRRPGGLGVDRNILASALGATERGFREDSVPEDIEKSIIESRDTLLGDYSSPLASEPDAPSLLDDLAAPGKARPVFEDPKPAKQPARGRPAPAPKTARPQSRPQPRRSSAPAPTAVAPAAPKPAAAEEDELDIDLEALEAEIAGDEPVAKAAPAPAPAEDTVEEEDTGEIDVDLDALQADVGADEGEVELSDEEQAALNEVLGDDLGDDDLLGDDLELDELLGDDDLGLDAGDEEPAEEEAPAEEVEEQEEAEEEGEGEEEEEGEGEGEGEEEEEYEPQTIFEKIVAKLDLSMTELIAICVGLFLVFLLALILAIVFYQNYSPQVAEDLLRRANENYKDEKYAEAQGLYDEFLKTFPPGRDTEMAYFRAAESYFLDLENRRIAAEDNNEDMTQIRKEYADARDAYNAFLNFQKEITNFFSEKSDEVTNYRYPDSDLEEAANWRIAETYDRQQEYQYAIEKYDDFMSKFPESKRKDNAIREIPRLYDQWAQRDAKDEVRLRLDAIEQYHVHLKIPQEPSLEKAKVHLAIARDHQRLFELADNWPMQESRLQSTEDHLRKASELIAEANPGNYIKENISTGESSTFISNDLRDIKLQLADLLRIRGERSAMRADEIHQSLTRYPRGHPRRVPQEESEKEYREEAGKRLEEAIDLYTIVDRDADFDPPEREWIRYHRALAYYTLDDFDKTIELGQELTRFIEQNENMGSAPTDVKFLVHFLLGDAAWETHKYDMVKKHYQIATSMEPYYPRDKGGEHSHLAYLRLSNTYFQKERDYDRAVKDYTDILASYPKSGWTYYTRYSLAEAYRKRGLEHINSTDPDERASAREDFGLAVDQYTIALETRQDAKYVDTQNETYKRQSEYHRAECSFLNGALRRSVQFHQQAIWNYPNDPEAPQARERLGDIYVQLGNLDGAVNVYTHYLKSAYENDEGRVTIKLADALLQRFDYKEARQYLEEVYQDYPVILKDPRFPSKKERIDPGRKVLYRLAHSYVDEADGLFEEQRAERLRDAIDAYQRIRDEMADQEVEPIREMGCLYFQLAEIVPDGEEYYRKATEHLDAYLKLFGSNDEVTEDPLRSHYLFMLGDANYRLEDYEASVAALRQVDGKTTKDNNEWGQAFLMLANSYRKLMEEAKDPFWRDEYLKLANNAYENTKMSGDADVIAKANLEQGYLASMQKAEGL